MREVSVSEFAKAHATGATVIDGGATEEYNRRQIPGAVSLPLRDLSRGRPPAAAARRISWQCSSRVTSPGRSTPSSSSRA